MCVCVSPDFGQNDIPFVDRKGHHFYILDGV